MKSTLPSLAASDIGVLVHTDRLDISYCPLLARVQKGATQIRLKYKNRWEPPAARRFLCELMTRLLALDLVWSC